MIRDVLGLKTRDGWRFSITPPDLHEYFGRIFEHNPSSLMHRCRITGRTISDREAYDEAFWRYYFEDLFRRQDPEYIKHILERERISASLVHEREMFRPTHEEIGRGLIGDRAISSQMLANATLDRRIDELTRDRMQRKIDRDTIEMMERAQRQMKMQQAPNDPPKQSKPKKVKEEPKPEPKDFTKLESNSKPIVKELQEKTDEWLADVKHLTEVKKPEKKKPEKIAELISHRISGLSGLAFL